MFVVRLLRRGFGSAWPTRLVVAVLGVWAGGCVSKPKQPPPFTPPPLAIAGAHFTGGPLGVSGEAAQSASPAGISSVPTEAMAVRVTFFALENRPALVEGARSVASIARLVAASSGGVAVLSAPRLAADAFFVPAEAVSRFRGALDAGQFGRWAPLGGVALAVPRGATAEADATDPAVQVDPATSLGTHRRVALNFYRSTPPLSNSTAAPADEILGTGLVVEDVDRGESAQGSGAATPAASMQKEVVLFDPVPVGGPTQFVLLIPFHTRGHASWGLAAVVSATPGNESPEHRRLVAQCMSELTESAQVASHKRAPAEGPAAGNEDRAETEAALILLREAGRQRQALAFLADRSRAELCRDVALAADDPSLSRLCEKIAAAAGSLQSAKELNWVLERTTLEVLSDTRGGAELAPELKSVLTEHAGEAGRHLASVAEAMKGAKGPADLEARLVAENLLFLDDAAPSSRVRAFEWLGAKRKAPAGYDPLAPAKQRRAALDKAINPKAAGAAGGMP